MKRAGFRSVLFASLLLCSNGAYSADICDSLLLTPQQLITKQTDTIAHGQMATRTLYDYVKALRLQTLLQEGQKNPDFHWLDVGGGAGVAALQSFSKNPKRDDSDVSTKHSVTVISVEDIFEKTYPENRDQALIKISQKGSLKHPLPEVQKQLIDQEIKKYEELRKDYKEQSENQRYRYLTGRFFESISDEEIGKADLITDFYGAFSYSPNKLQILLKMARLLKPGGVARIQTQIPYIILSDGDRDVEKSWMIFFDRKIPGISFQNDFIIMKPTQETIRVLTDLASDLVFERATNSNPPTFYYRLASPLKP